MKNEPEWMRDFRLKALDYFEKRPMPTWGADLDGASTSTTSSTTSSPPRSRARPGTTCPAYIKDTFDKLGIPEAERKFLAGVGAQYESEVVYHSLREDLEKLGVIFLDMDTAVREHPDLVKEYFGTIIPPNDNKFAALNSAVWSGGSFVYVPEGVKVDIPLQAYFRINAENMGQFERTLIICEKGSYVHYVEGCTAPTYSTDSLHSAVVEIIVKEGARCRYTTIQNWSKNVYNLVTKRAAAYQQRHDGVGRRQPRLQDDDEVPGRLADGAGRARRVLSVAFAGDGQHQDAGGKIVHAAPHTSSQIISKSISKGTGRSSLPRPAQGAQGRAPRQVQRRLRRAAARRDAPHRHLPVHRDRGRRSVDRPRGHGLEGRRRAALLPDEPRHQRGRGHEHDRQRASSSRSPRSCRWSTRSS